MLKKFFALLCILMCLASAAFASYDHLYTDSVTLYPVHDAGVSRHIFVRTNSGWFSSKTVKLGFDKGQLHVDFSYKGSGSLSGYGMVYPSVEAKIWYWDVQYQDWLLERKFDIYCQDDYEIELEKEDVYYCIELYFWRPSTVADSYERYDKFPYGLAPVVYDKVVDAYWSPYALPSVTAEPGFDMNMYIDNPMYSLPNEK